MLGHAQRYLARRNHASGGRRFGEELTQHADGLAERLPIRVVQALEIGVDGGAAIQSHLPQRFDTLRCDADKTARASPGSTVRDTKPPSSSLRTWVVMVGCEQWSSAARSDIRVAPWSSIVDSSRACAYGSGSRDAVWPAD